MTDFQVGSLLLVAAAAFLTFILSAVQASINARHGTDHAVHSFLIRCIRQNNFRFFVRIPNLLNTAYIGALPLYLHWIFAHFPQSVMRRAELLLNPSMNALHVLLVAAVAGWAGGADAMFVAVCALLFALTPQFYHALSARNFGLSARSIGLVFLTSAFAGAYLVENDSGSAAGWAMLILSCYLVWAFSTFGAQALVIISALAAIGTGHIYPAIGTIAGLGVFAVLHPRYSAGYLYHTVRFVRAYARELAPVYVLSRRYGIWRDLVWDIWIKIARGPSAGLHYAYENSVLITILLNPLLFLAIIGKASGISQQDPLIAYACDLALAGGLAMVLTSFRATRFLGEPERYIEAVTPWAVIGGASVLIVLARDHVGGWTADQAGLILAGIFFVAAIVQITGSKILSNYLDNKPHQLDDAMLAIAQGAGPDGVRFCSNNEQYTKLMLPNDWQFSYCIAVGSGYCGMTMGEAFSRFPFLRREAMETIVSEYRVNTCALDRQLYDSIFDQAPAGLRAMETQFLSESLRVLKLEWAEPAKNAAQSPAGS